MGRRIIAAFGFAAVLAPGMATAQEGDGKSAGHWADIAQCAAIDAAEPRHECMDAVLRRAGLLSEARIAQTAREEFGSKDSSERPRPAVSPAEPTAAAHAPAAAPTRARDIDELDTTIASARLRGDRRLIVTTAEGAVWEQTQSETFRTMPEAGDAFSIERTALGGFRCSFERSTVYRCRRTN